MKKIVSCYVPFNVNNLYVENLKRLIRKQNIDVLPIKKCLINIKIFKECKIYNFNWFENPNSNRKIINCIIYYLKVLLLKWLKLNNKKIIYTIHNKKPHNFQDNEYCIKIMKKQCEYADIILGLCDDTKQVIKSFDEKYLKKLVIVPHPNYVSNYEFNGYDNERKKFGIEDDELVFLFIGAVSKYKNIEMLIDIFKNMKEKKVKLFICGKPSSKDYKLNLINRINNEKNIIYDFRYIPDEQITKYYSISDIVVLPYNKETSMNSGAVYLSFSLKKTVICPNIGTIKELKKTDFVYSYDYEDTIYHKLALEKRINDVYIDFMKNKVEIKEKGKKAYEYVLKYHSDNLVSNMYGEIYRNLLLNS